MMAMRLLVGIGNAVTLILFVGMFVLGILSLASLALPRLRWARFYCWRLYAAFAAANLVTLFPGTWADGESYGGAVIAVPWVVFSWLLVLWRKDRPPTTDTEPEPGTHGCQPGRSGK